MTYIPYIPYITNNIKYLYVNVNIFAKQDLERQNYKTLIVKLSVPIKCDLLWMNYGYEPHTFFSKQTSNI